jgi:TatA/E family protein of Tat protein translocase
MPLNLGLGEILVVLVVALLVFGGRLPQIGRSLGRGLVEFKKGLSGVAAEVEAPEKPAEEKKAGEKNAEAAPKEADGDPVSRDPAP